MRSLCLEEGGRRLTLPRVNSYFIFCKCCKVVRTFSSVWSLLFSGIASKFLVYWEDFVTFQWLWFAIKKIFIYTQMHVYTCTCTCIYLKWHKGVGRVAGSLAQFVILIQSIKTFCIILMFFPFRLQDLLSPKQAEDTEKKDEPSKDNQRQALTDQRYFQVLNSRQRDVCVADIGFGRSDKPPFCEECSCSVFVSGLSCLPWHTHVPKTF